MAGFIARLEAATDLQANRRRLGSLQANNLLGEITEVLEDDNIPQDGAEAVEHTVGEGSMAASFNLNSGLELPAALPPPATIAKVQEDRHTFLYHVAAILCDALGWTLRGSGSGSLISRGRVHDFATELPDGQEIVVLEIYIMEEVMMLDFIRNFFSLLRKKGYEFISLSDTHGWVYKHDCVVVKIAEGIWIKGEKGGESSPLKNDGGIKLEQVRSSCNPKDWKDPGDLDSGRYSVRFTAVIKLGEGKEKFTVGQLKQLLKPSCGLDYNIFSANCWQYAFSSVNNVLIWILENSEEVEVRGEIRQKLEELAKLERPMLKDIFLALWNPSAPGSNEIIVTFRQKLAGTFEGLPPNAKVRRFLVRGTQTLVEWRASKRRDGADDGESASLSTSSDAEPSIEDEDGDHSIPVNEEYSEMMQESIQPTQYVYCSPFTMDSGPWTFTTPSVEPLLRQRKKKLPPNSGEGPISASMDAQSRNLHYD